MNIDIETKKHRDSIRLNEKLGDPKSIIHQAALFFEEQYETWLKAWYAHRDDVPEIKGLQVACNEFQQGAFPNATTEGVLKHLRQEVDEVESSPQNLTEHADLLILHLQVMGLEGIDVQDVLAAAWAKLEINKKRKWADTGEGHYQHVEDADV